MIAIYFSKDMTNIKFFFTSCPPKKNSVFTVCISQIQITVFIPGTWWSAQCGKVYPAFSRFLSLSLSLPTKVEQNCRTNLHHKSISHITSITHSETWCSSTTQRSTHMKGMKRKKVLTRQNSIRYILSITSTRLHLKIPFNRAKWTNWQKLQLPKGSRIYTIHKAPSQPGLSNS